MERRPINEKPKKRKGLIIFIIILILAGFAASVFLFGQGSIGDIIHP